MSFVFDMVGFWTAVTFIMIVLFYGVTLVCVKGLDLWCGRITGGTKAVSSKIPKFLSFGDTEWTALAKGFVCVWSCGALGYFLLLPLIDGLDESVTYIDLVVSISTALAPIYSWLVSLAVVLFTIDYLAKKGYNLHKRLSKLEELDNK